MQENYILDKALLEKRLKELAETPYTGEIRLGAMCYSPVVSTYEYKCELCGKTTEQTVCGINEVMYITTLVNEIKNAGYDVLLDGRDYCQYCKTPEPEGHNEYGFIRKHKVNGFVFMIRFNDNKDYHVVKTSNIDNYRCLKTFLINDDNFKGSYGQTCVLHENIDIIHKMTGLGAETVIEWSKSHKYRGKYSND